MLLCMCDSSSQATGGQDSILRVWVLKSCFGYFEDIRRKYEDGQFVCVCMCVCGGGRVLCVGAYMYNVLEVDQNVCLVGWGWGV